MKKQRSAEEIAKRKTRRKKGWLIALSVVVVIALAICLSNVFTNVKSETVKNSYEEVGRPDDVAVSLDEDGNYVLTADRDLKIMQLTDVHIGGGFLSGRKDRLALNAVAAMITAEKPDLVIITGDISFAVPYIAGTFNNMSAAKLFCNMMDKLGVYYTVAFGNHDSEAYNYYTRESIANYYAKDTHTYSLFKLGPEEVDGYGNQVINVKNSQGIITETLYVIDSHSYTDGDFMGINWIYDNIHDNQIEWYKENVEKNNAANLEKIKSMPSEMQAELTEKYGVVKSLAFFHIPVEEYKYAYEEFKDNGFSDTENVKYVYGEAGESGQMVYSPKYENTFFETVCQLKSTQGLFVGHDHLNNFSYEYKGVRLTYGFSIDFLAYSGIDCYGAQRGCTIITVKQNGEFDAKQENYYQDKYVPANGKEEVIMDPYYDKLQSAYIDSITE